MPGKTPQEVAHRIAVQVQRRAATGVQAAAVFLAARLKEVLSVPAPRKRVQDRAGNFYYRATTRAIRGAPPRKLSGKMRQGVTYTIAAPINLGKKVAMASTVGLKARSPKGFNYPRALEHRGHPYFWKTVQRWRPSLAVIVGRAIRTGRPT